MLGLFHKNFLFHNDEKFLVLPHQDRQLLNLLKMILHFVPGDRVINPSNKNWGIGQVQSIIKQKVTVNFENVGKKVINAKNIKLEKFQKND